MKKLICVSIAIFMCAAAFLPVFSVGATAENRYCIIRGMLDKRMSGRYISVLLVGKSDGELGHIGMTEVNDDGSYFYKFLFYSFET